MGGLYHLRFILISLKQRVGDVWWGFSGVKRAALVKEVRPSNDLCHSGVGRALIFLNMARGKAKFSLPHTKS